MTPQQMIKTPVEKRRGAVTNQSARYRYLILEKEPDAILDALLASKVIGAARRDCLNASLAGEVPRPSGPWGMLIRLKGHPYTYFKGDKFDENWAAEWAGKLGCRSCHFMSTQMGVHLARCYEGKSVLFDFAHGHIETRPADAVYRQDLNESEAIIHGKSEVCTQAWLDQQTTGGDALDALAQFAGVYIPICLVHRVEESNAKPYGWDGDAHPEGDEELYQELPESAFERIDVFTFGGPETLQPSEANLMLAAAVHRCDAAGAEAALKAGADPNLMADDDESPLIVALGHASPYLKGGRFAGVAREQLLDLMRVLLKAGAKPDPEGASAIHTALHWAQGGDEKTIIDQLRVLLDHGADPNSPSGKIIPGELPLHALVRFDQWLGATKLLVSRGADPKSKNAQGKSAREMAEQSLAQLQKTSTAKPADPAATGKDAQQAAALAAALAKLRSASTAANQQKIVRLTAMITFLESAERGNADASDIDAIVGQSIAQHQAEEEKRNAEAKEHIKSLLEKKQKLLQQAGADKTITSAQKIIADNKKLFIERYEYRPATDADFAVRDRAWYDSMKNTFTLLGFRWLGDFVNESVFKAAGVLAIMRRFVSADGTTMAVVYQVVRENKVKKITVDLRVYECETELSDGSFITTGNTGGANLASKPKQIHATLLPADTSPADLVKQHEATKAIALKQDPALRFTIIKSMEDYTAAQDRQSAITAAFRQGIGFLDPAEIRRIAEHKFPDDPVKVALMTVGASTAQQLEQLKKQK